MQVAARVFQQPARESQQLGMAFPGQVPCAPRPQPTQAPQAIVPAQLAIIPGPPPAAAAPWGPWPAAAAP
eukprot:11155504-Lingulodinium_polyedra.AAC.1